MVSSLPGTATITARLASQEILLAVLLNRSGRTELMPAGYSDSGFDISFSDSAPADIHSYRLTTTGSSFTPLSTIPPFDGILTGPWQPDARLVDPYAVLESSPRTAFLAPLDSWSVTLTHIPEPAPLLPLAAGLLLLTLLRPILPVDLSEVCNTPEPGPRKIECPRSGFARSAPKNFARNKNVPFGALSKFNSYSHVQVPTSLFRAAGGGGCSRQRAARHSRLFGGPTHRTLHPRRGGRMARGGV